MRTIFMRSGPALALMAGMLDLTRSAASAAPDEDTGVIAEIGLVTDPPVNLFTRSFLYVTIESSTTGANRGLCDGTASAGTKAYYHAGQAYPGFNPGSDEGGTALLSMLSAALVSGVEITLVTESELLNGTERCVIKEVRVER